MNKLVKSIKNNIKIAMLNNQETIEIPTINLKKLVDKLLHEQKRCCRLEKLIENELHINKISNKKLSAYFKKFENKGGNK